MDVQLSVRVDRGSPERKTTPVHGPSDIQVKLRSFDRHNSVRAWAIWH